MFSKFKNVEKNLRYKSFIKDKNKFYNLITIETINICNLNCVHCNYMKRKNKKDEVTTIMSLELFEDIVDQLCKFGFSYFALTPMTGEILLDKFFKERLDILENHPGVDGYYFYTNLSINNNDYLDKILSVKKLRWLGISSYGINLDEFVKFTKSDKNYYFNFINNLKYFLDKKININLNLPIYTSTEHSFSKLLRTDLYKLLIQLSSITNTILMIRNDFCDRSGYITKKELQEVNPNFKFFEKDNDRKLMCHYFLTRNLITTNGIVIGCACSGDIYFKTKFGNINTTKLSEIYKSNEYLNLFNNHEYCKNCNSYESIDLKNLGNADSNVLIDIYNWRNYGLRSYSFKSNQ